MVVTSGIVGIMTGFSVEDFGLGCLWRLQHPSRVFMGVGFVISVIRSTEGFLR